jgi:two-component system, OmpR family, alkaline phosphatase synthesis response regulator PhoP
VQLVKTILVIEDEQTVRESIVDLLEVEGFSPIGAANGRLGLDLARQTPPDLILCDVQMPEMDGYTVLTQLRASPETARVPFIFLTAKSTKADFRQGMELGADDYLQKPCTATELLGAINARLAKRAATAPEPPPACSSSDGLLNYFYQELRNPLSNLNTVIDLLNRAELNRAETGRALAAQRTVELDYAREMSVLQEIYKLRDCLAPECLALLQACAPELFLDAAATPELAA